MNALRFIGASLRFHRRIHLAVALGVMAATAVLTGALVIGDSVRGSLRQLTFDRLGPVDIALVAGRFFRTELASECTQRMLEQAPRNLSGVMHEDPRVVPAIVLEASLERPDEAQPVRAGGVSLYACDEHFFTAWDHVFGAKRFPTPRPAKDEILLSESLARDLLAKPGDELLVRFPTVSDVPRESALGKKTETTDVLRLKVAHIFPTARGPIDERAGRFGLSPQQQTPRNAFVNLRQLQTALRQYSRREKRDRVNALFVLGEKNVAPNAYLAAQLEQAFSPQLEDYGLTITASDDGRLLTLGSRHLVLEPAAIDAVAAALPQATRQGVSTYLANTIAARPGADDERTTPYSTITAIDFAAAVPLGPMVDPAGQPIAPLAAGEIALNTWAAEDLQAKVGDEIAVTYFEPESTHGAPSERTAKFRLKAIVQMTGAGADRSLTPEFPGVTDKAKIGEWAPPFPYDSSRIRGKDEDYWDEFKALPKAFVSLAEGQRLWGSRFGALTSVRMARPATDQRTLPELEQALAAKLRPAEMGLAFRPVKAEGLAAASGSTPFDLLFLGFSFFLIAAALMLVSLMFRLGVEGRAREIGTLLAAGLRLATVRRLLAAEGLVVAALGGLAGVGLGVGYAWLMLAALRSPQWWLAAVGTPFLQLHAHAVTCLLGYAIGVGVSYLTLWLGVRRLGQFSVRQLVGGTADEPDTVSTRPPRIAATVCAICLLLAGPVAGLAWNLSGEAQAGAFFGAGALVLTGLLAGLRAWLVRRGSRRPALVSPGALARLAVRNAARNPSRSVLTVGLVGSATFLIVAISAFRIDPASFAVTRDSGNGGFTLVAQSDQPLYQDLGAFATPAGRQDFALTEADVAALEGLRAYSIRFRAGDDASCRNLYQTDAAQIQTLGLPASFLDRGGFAWAGSLAQTDDERANPWLLVAKPGEGGRVPIVLDAATAQYSLKVGLGSVLASRNDAGQPIELVVVGLLKNSLLQGMAITGETPFLAAWPRQSGYRFFLLETPPERTADIARTLERLPALAAVGLSTERASERLAGFLAVQNTYLSTFQSLGGLGLLLGTLGLAAVQLRSVLERRGELALLRATGLRQTTLARLVMLENASLLLGGLGVGIVAALAAVLPHLWAGGAALPWTSLAGMLGLVAVVGLLASLSSVRAVLAAPLLPALKGS